MELWALQTIIKGLDSLAEIEKENPELGKKLLDFTNRVRECCNTAYQQLTKNLGAVRALPSKPSPLEIETVLNTLNETASSVWFRDVAKICEHLAAIAKEYEPSLVSQMHYINSSRKDSSATSPIPDQQYPNPSTDTIFPRETRRIRISSLLYLLQRHEGDLK